MSRQRVNEPPEPVYPLSEDVSPALKMRARKLGYDIEPSVRRSGYCLWRVWPGIGRHMVIGGNDGVTLDTIAAKLDELEVEATGGQD
jgi:hypothetical protein